MTLKGAITAILLAMTSISISAVAQESKMITADNINAHVAESLKTAEDVYVSINGAKSKVLSIEPIMEGNSPSIALVLSPAEADSYLVLPMSVLADRGSAETQSQSVYVDAGKVPYTGMLNLSSAPGEFALIKGKLKTADGKSTVEIDGKLHDAIGGIGSSTIEVEGDAFVVNGTLGTITYKQLKEAIAANPQIKTVVLDQIEGSVNDDVNMHTGRLLRNSGLSTKVNASSKIYSGGVDLFASGNKRIYTPGATVGVHSWCCVDEKTAAELPKDHEGHKAQIQYFKEMLGEKTGPDFYFFTVNAAPFNSAHTMTPEEIKTFTLANETVSP